MFQRLPMALQEREQRAGALRKLEAVQQLVLEARHLAADEVADVQLRDLVVAHVEHGVALRRERGRELGGFGSAALQRHADEDARFRAGRVAVVELGDVAMRRALRRTSGTRPAAREFRRRRGLRGARRSPRAPSRGVSGRSSCSRRCSRRSAFARGSPCARHSASGRRPRARPRAPRRRARPRRCP